MSYVIDFGGILTEVPLSFFKFKEVRHDLIGDVHFINYGELTFSIHDNIWLQVQEDLRDIKINSLLDLL
jgi:hypothetical protein